VSRKRLAIVGLGMAVTPHARGLVDLADKVEVVHAFSPSEARRLAFAERFPFPPATLSTQYSRTMASRRWPFSRRPTPIATSPDDPRRPASTC
jgi:predicted dehydrogenase